MSYSSHVDVLATMLKKESIKLCTACGESKMTHWNQGIYECPECGNMDDLEDE